MTEQADELILDFEAKGGQHRLRSIDEVREWVQSESNTWQWMSAHPDRFGLWGHVSQRLNWLREQVQSAISQGQPLRNQGGHFNAVFTAESDFVLHSRGDLGRRVIDILESEGAQAALAAYALAARRVTMNQLGDLAEVRGAMMVAMPSLVRAEALQKRLTQERRNLNDRADRLLGRLNDEAVARRAQHEEALSRAQRVAILWARSRFKRWRSRFAAGEASARELTEAFAASHHATQEEFDTLKAAFIETMHLQAPATYWSTKAGKHKISEWWGIGRLALFFPLALGGLGWSFWRVSELLLTSPPTSNATALYVVASAGLATLAGITFWVGRLLTKLYLSEHHLRIDAEERAIMTTTYLALTKDAAATDADRGIILTALFRSTPDGIVKDDGSVDVSLAALLSKVGVPSR